MHPKLKRGQKRGKNERAKNVLKILESTTSQRGQRSEIQTITALIQEAVPSWRSITPNPRPKELSPLPSYREARFRFLRGACPRCESSLVDDFCPQCEESWSPSRVADLGEGQTR